MLILFFVVRYTSYAKESSSFPQLRPHRALHIFVTKQSLLSVMTKKRFHVTDTHVEKAGRHWYAIVNLWRYLNMSVTPILHCIEDHAVTFLQYKNIFVDIGEDVGERAHQEETRSKARVVAIHNIKKKETTNSHFEAMAKNVKMKVEELKQRSKRKLP